MRPIVPAFRHYFRMFREAVHDGGWGYALRRARSFLHHKIALKAGLQLSRGALGSGAEETSPFADIIEMLDHRPAERPLILIISNCAIRQCVHYRIRQKVRYLDQIGIQAMYLSPGEAGRIRAFLPLAHTVIIYRTALPDTQIDELRKAGVRIVFEFDDLIVSRVALEHAGILDQVTSHQAAGLFRQADDLLATAQRADALIVSTPFLASHYADPDHGLADKPCFVIPNFVETDDFRPAGPKTVTFAFTSPSGSIQSELAMLTAFLDSYDRQATTDWSILVIGNLTAQERLSAQDWRHGRVVSHPFSDFEDYLRTIASAETVLVPLSDTSFNRAKTPIRLMDAAIVGTQAVFCPVGTYADIGRTLAEIAPDTAALCVPPNDWAEAGGSLGPLLSLVAQNTEALKQAIREKYGTQAARDCYRAVLSVGLPSVPVPIPSPEDGLQTRGGRA